MDKSIKKKPFRFSSAAHSETVLAGLNSLREQQLLFDMTLVVDGHRFPVHRTVLAACSEYFRAMFTDAMKERQQDEIHLIGVSAVGVRHVLDYAYTSCIALDLKNVQAVLSAASHLQMLAVIGACAEFLYTEIDMENCVDIITISETFTLPDLSKYGYSFISKHLDKLTFYQDFNRRLTAEQLSHLLSGKFMVSCSEAEVLKVTHAWIMFDFENRWHHRDALFGCINLGEILVSEMEDTFRDLGCSVYNITARPYVQQLLQKGAQHVYQTEACEVGVVNIRGMQRAVVNIGGFLSCSGLTNSLTYLASSLRSWCKLTEIPQMDQSDYGVTVLNNELYVIGGIVYEQNEDSEHCYGLKYNPCTGKWTGLPMMNKERCSFYLATFESKIYAIGGEQTGACECYNPERNDWTDICSIPDDPDRAAGAVSRYSGTIYIAGGTYGLSDDPDDRVWAYNIHYDNWNNRMRMLSPRADHDMEWHAGKIYVAGGWSNTQNGERLLSHTLDIYDEVCNQWHVVTQLPNPRYFASLSCVQGKLYFIGGRQLIRFDRGSKDVDMYDLETEEWSLGAEYPVEIWEHQSCELLIPCMREDAIVQL